MEPRSSEARLELQEHMTLRQIPKSANPACLLPAPIPAKTQGGKAEHVKGVAADRIGPFDDRLCAASLYSRGQQAEALPPRPQGGAAAYAVCGRLRRRECGFRRGKQATSINRDERTPLQIQSGIGHCGACGQRKPERSTGRNRRFLLAVEPPACCMSRALNRCFG